MRDTALRRLLRRLRPGGDPIERCVPDVRQDIFYAFLAMYRLARPLARGRRVLDAGCGTGYGDRYLAENGAAEVVGVDVDRRAITYARTHFPHPRVRFEHVANNRYPVGDGAFDLVFSSNVIEHVDDHRGYLREVKRVLAPGGAFLLVTPVVEASGQSDHPYHITNLTPEEWQVVLAEHFREVGVFGVYLRAYPQHVVPWLLTPLVQRLAVSPMFRALAQPLRDRLHRDVMFNPFGLWEGDFEVEPCAPTSSALASSMAYLAICRDAPGPTWEELAMHREPRPWSSDEVALCELWRDLRRAFARHWLLVAGPGHDEDVSDIVWRPPPELWGSRRLRGEFRAPERPLRGLRINFATFARQNSGSLSLRLLDEAEHVRAEAVIDVAGLTDGGFADVLFGQPIALRAGERSAFDLWSDTARPGNAVTAWTRFDSSLFEPGRTCAETHGAWGGVVHEVICD